MSETITYWDNGGNNHLHRNSINIDSIDYVSHDEKTVTVIGTYFNPDWQEQETTKTYYRNLEDAKDNIIKYLQEHISRIQESIERVRKYKER